MNDFIDWIMEYLMGAFLFLFFVVFLIITGISIEKAFQERNSPTINLIKQDWDCTKIQTFMSGKITERRCIQYNRTRGLE